MIRRKSFEPDPKLSGHIAELDRLGERMRSAAAHCRFASAGAAEVEDRGRQLALRLGQNSPLITETKEPTWQPAPPQSPRPKRPASPASAITTQRSLPST